MAHPHASVASTDPQLAFGKRLDDIGWALFLIVTGVVWLFPATQIPPGTWLIATGLLVLGLNAIRAIAKVPRSGFMTLLGALALVAGLSALWGVNVPVAAICLIVLGIGLLARQVGRQA
jgi:hypothetical protein